MQRSDEGWGGRCDHVPTLSYVRVVIRRPLSPSAAWEKLLVWGMALNSHLLASGPGWSVSDVACTAGPHDRPFEERHDAGVHRRGDRGHVPVPLEPWLSRARPWRLPARAASRTGQAGATSGASPMRCGR